MMYPDAARIIVLIASTMITTGLYNQLLKIWRTHKAKDLSGLLVASIIISELAWLNYGVAINEWPMIIIGITNMPATIGIAIGFVRWGKENQHTASNTLP